MKFKRRWQKIFLSISLCVFTTLVTLHWHNPKPAIAATTYYVATNGNNSNPGTQTQPFATLAYAVSKVKAGDTVYMRGGTYYLTQKIWIPHKGTASAPITFQAYPGEKVIIDGSKLPTNDGVALSIGGEYITIKGFEVRNAKDTGLVIWGGKHIKFLNNIVHDSQRHGIFGSYTDLNQVTDILIEGNTVYHNNLQNSSHNSQIAMALGIGGVGNIKIINNKVYENQGEGIDFWGVGALISRNTVYDNYSVEMYLDGASNTTVERNLIYTTYNSKYYRSGHPASGIQVANEHGKTQLDKNKIVNNIAIGGSWGFYYGNYSKGGGMRNMLIANNTFYKGTRGIIGINQDAGHQNTVFANNIFYQTPQAGMTWFSANSAFKFFNNCWYGGSAGPGAGVGDVYANPKLVQPGTTKASDYKPQNGSPVIEAGSTINAVTNDYLGSTRPLGQKYDIGAYEYSS